MKITIDPARKYIEQSFRRRPESSSFNWTPAFAGVTKLKTYSGRITKLPAVLLGLIAALAIGSAHARECKGVAFPEQVQSEGGTLKLNGLGLRQATFMKVSVYVAALYVPQTSRDAGAILKSAAPRELILHFVRDVGHADLSKAWDEGFENNAKGNSRRSRIASRPSRG